MLTLEREQVAETTTRFVYPRPITFNEWLEISGSKDFTELIDGTIVEKPMVQLEHEKLNLWLFQVLGTFADERQLGTILGSRSPVRINEFRGRMPNFFFVRKSREELLTSKATLGAPGLVIELVSPNDRRSDINATETDYRAIGVAEIVYINQDKGTVRILRKTDTGYTEYAPASVPIVLQTLGVTLEWDWILAEPRPSVLQTVQRLLQPEERKMATVWRIMAHWDDPSAALLWAKGNNRVGIGWDIGDIRDHSSIESIKEAVHDTGNQNWGVSGRQLWAFCHDMKHGDLVIYRGTGAGEVIARITGDYEHFGDDELALHHQRKAEILPVDGAKLWRLAGGCAEGYTTRWTVMKCANKVDIDDL